MGASHLSPTRLARTIAIACGGLLLAGFVAGSAVPGVVGVTMLAYLVHTRAAAAAALRSSVARVERTIEDMGLYEGQVFRVTVNAQESRLQPGVRATFWDLVPSAIEVAEQPSLEGPTVLTYDARAVAKGNVAFRAVRVDLLDSRGLWRTTRLHAVETRLRVLSGLEHVKNRRLSGRRSQESTIPAALGKLVRDLEFETVRPYVSGDRLRDMDWKRTSKYDDLMTKQWEKQGESALLFLVDASRTMRARHRGPSKLERALQWTLELADSSVSQNQAVGHLVFDEVGVVDEMAPTTQRGVGSRMASRFTDLPQDIEAWRRLDVAGPAEAPPDAEEKTFLDRLEELRGTTAQHSRDAAGSGVQRAVTRTLSRRGRKTMHIVVFTDLEGFPDASVQALSQAVHQGHTAVVAVLPGTRFVAPPEEPTLRDLENAYREETARTHCRALLQARGIRLLELSPTDASLRVLDSRKDTTRRRSA